MGKPTICIGENKVADQLRSNCEADQRLCFRYSDSTVPILLKSEISSFCLFSVLVQAGLCRTCSETALLGFPRGGSMLCDSPMRCRNRPDMTKSILWNVKQNIKHISNHCNFNVRVDNIQSYIIKTFDSSSNERQAHKVSLQDGRLSSGEP